jgi:hypothetical protein
MKPHSLPHPVTHYQVDESVNAIGVKTAVIPKHPIKRQLPFFFTNNRIRRKILPLTGNKKAGAISTRLISADEDCLLRGNHITIGYRD